MTDTWDPTQYDKFQREREQPFFDLLALVQPAPGMRVVDLGCGTGKLTRALHEQLAAAETDGHVTQLDGGANGRHVRRDRHEDAVGDVEDRLVEGAVGRMQVDDDDVHPASCGGQGRRHPGGVEDVGVQR